MKTIFTIIIGALLLASLNLPGLPLISGAAAQQNEPQSVQYTRQELISFTWGKEGNYTLGSDYDKFYDSNGKWIGLEGTGSENGGPNQIKVNNKGEIYIHDLMNNRRTLVYDSRGIFIKSHGTFGIVSGIAFDEQDNLYLNLYGSFIEKYSQDLKFIQRFENIVSGGRSRMIVDDSRGKILISHDKPNFGKVITEVDFKQPPVEIEREINGVMTKVKMQPSTTTKAKLVEQVQKRDSSAVFNILSLKSGRQITTEIKSVKNKPAGYLYDIGFQEWIGEDRNGNIYTTARFDPNLMTINRIVLVYDRTGKLISEITLDKEDNIFFEQGGCFLVDVDNEGNIYHLCIKKSGAKLIKWRAQ